MQTAVGEGTEFAATGKDDNMRSWLWIVLLAALAVGACAEPPGPLAIRSATVADRGTIFVVRHLHKAQGDDPSLNSQGAEAARRLAEMLAEKGIAAIFATPTRRAMETAGPLAERLGVSVTPYDPRQPQALVAAADKVGGSLLIVGHSNTVHDLIGRFGATPPPPLEEQDYGTVFAIGPEGRLETFEIR